MKVDHTEVMPSPTWVEQERREHAEPVPVDPFLKRLAESGVLDEAEKVWDAEDAGLNPCDSVPVQDLVAGAEEHRK